MSEGARERKQISLEIQDPSLLTGNKREKIFGNLLTNPKIYDTITTKDKEKDTLKNRKGKTLMKKATLETIRKTLVEEKLYYDTDEIIKELDAEINRGAAEKAARAEAYEGIHSLIVDNLNDTPITCADLFVEIEPEVVAKGLNRHNVQYALNNLWQDEIEKIPGKPNTYKRR